MICWRICKSKYAEDLSGTGAGILGGRWNSPGLKVLYTSSTASLALLEILTWTSFQKLARNKFKILEIDIPALEEEQQITSIGLSANWQLPQNYAETRSLGDRWIKEASSFTMTVPSAILPMENNIILNPTHPGMTAVKITNVFDLAIDARLLGE